MADEFLFDFYYDQHFLRPLKHGCNYYTWWLCISRINAKLLHYVGEIIVIL